MKGSEPPRIKVKPQNTNTMKAKNELKAWVVDLKCNCNCFEGTESECKAEIDELVNEYGHDRKRYTIRFTRFD